MTIQHTTDFTATEPEVIDQIANELSTSALKRAVFEEIYRGGKRPKTAEEIGSAIGKDAKQVLTLASPMADKKYFQKVKVEGKTSYAKFPHLNAVKGKILRLAKNPEALEKLVTVRKPRVSTTNQLIRISVPANAAPIRIIVEPITIDAIDEFQKVRELPASELDGLDPMRLPEEQFKYGVARIIGDQGTFKDWPGERNDLFTNVTVDRKRMPCAIAFKGPATAPPLTIKKMGKNGNQIPKLFVSTAQVFLIQFEGQVDEDVVRLMRTQAVEKAVETGLPIYFGIIGYEDSHRLRTCYAVEFEAAKKRP